MTARKNPTSVRKAAAGGGTKSGRSTLSKGKTSAAKKTAPAKKGASSRKAPAKSPASPNKAPAKKASASKKNSVGTKSAAPTKASTRKAAEKRPPASSQRSTSGKSSSANLSRKPAAAPFSVPAGREVRLLDVPFDDRQIAASSGARWNPDLRSWLVFTSPGAELPAALSTYAPPRFSWEAWREDDLNRRPRRHVDGSGVTLHPHQQLAADLIGNAWAAGRPGALLADEVGLGKTFSALAGVNRILEPKNVLVLCPLSVVAHWRSSIAAIGSHHRFCVVNYDRAKKLLDVPDTARTARRVRTRNQRIATKGVSLVSWDVVIADESHLLKNPTAQRSSAVRQLQGGSDRAAFTVWCSATAGQNPVELSYLNRLIAAGTGVRVGSGLDDFARWCKSLDIKVRKSFGGLAWSPNDEDLAKMHALLFTGEPPVALRRRPSDIAGWPELERIAWPVELDPSDRSLYRQAWAEVRSVVHADRERRRRGERPRRGVADPTNPLVSLLRFRQKASGLRVDSTVDLVELLLENGKQVAVSVEFRDTLDTIVGRLTARKVPVASIHGGLSADERESQRLAFQQGACPVVVFSVKEGISLHAGELSSDANSVPRVTVVHDPRWDAISTAQIEGRTWRDGQHSTCYHMFAEGTVEERVVSTMLTKLSSMKTMLADSDRDDVLDLLDQVVSSE